MAPPTRTPPARWVDEGLRALAAGGPDAVRVEALARALGVTKGGFYNHFEDRPALLASMLDAWERLVVDEVIDRLRDGGGDARAKLRGLFDLGAAGAGDLLRVELAVRDWARRDREVAERLERVDTRRLEFLRSLFGEFCPDSDEVELRSLVVLSMFVGVPAVAASYGPRRRGELHRRAFERLLT